MNFYSLFGVASEMKKMMHFKKILWALSPKKTEIKTLKNKLS